MDAVLVLLLLVLIWAAVLIPPWLQSRRRRTPTASMSSFNRQLWHLAQASPGYPATEGRWRGGGPVTVLGQAAGSGSAAGGVVTLDDVDVDGDGQCEGESEAAELASVHEAAAAGNGQGDPVRSAAVAVAPPAPSVPLGPARRPSLGYQRRRRVLTALLVAVSAALPPALLVGHVAWWAVLATASTLLLGYVGLLVRRVRRLRERQRKIRYLMTFRPPRPSVVVLHGGAAR